MSHGPTVDLPSYWKVNGRPERKLLIMLIGALADTTGVPAKTLRYWESEGLLREPARTAGGYRYYPPDAADRVAFIRHAQAAGLTLPQIRAVLAVRDDGHPPCHHAADLVDERLGDVEQRLRELQQTYTSLRDLRRRLAELDPADCEPTEVCSAMTPPRG